MPPDDSGARRAPASREMAPDSDPRGSNLPGSEPPGSDPARSVGPLPEPSPEFRAVDWDAWRPDLEATLLFVVRRQRVLLIHKKRGLGAGKLNAAGGKVDDGEAPAEAAIREFIEELGARPIDPRKVGEVAFHVIEGDSILIHVFRAEALEGDPVETAEATPCWVPVDDIPYDRMWADDRYWLPLLLEGRTFGALTVFDDDRLLGVEVRTPLGPARVDPEPG